MLAKIAARKGLYEIHSILAEPQTVIQFYVWQILSFGLIEALLTETYPV